MSGEIVIRETVPADLAAIVEVHKKGFGYDKEAGLTAELLSDPTAEPTVSLLALRDGEAVGHIASHSTGHSEAILTRDEAHAALFTAAVDSAAVYVNCSTRFTDGGEFGLGCEMGISTQKLHARGPMGLEELCSYKYIIHGSGQIR